MTKILFVLLSFLNIHWALAQEVKSGKIKTLDFEGEVIEGEAMRPMLYLQIESPDLDLNNIIYQRRDFNDFHKIDKVRRNRFIPDQR